MGELKKAENKLEKILTVKAEGSLRFTFVKNQRYYEMGNRASRLSAFQLRKTQVNRHVSKIKHPSCMQTKTLPKEIAEAFADNYK